MIGKRAILTSGVAQATAHAQCQGLGGTLAVIETEAEHQFMVEAIPLTDPLGRKEDGEISAVSM